ncbi:DNA ligase [Pseudomonas phage Henninger]|uniref:DNA ligase n=1 Tax=Pseudomonas phage Henninger TaxID=2079287 RepID=A0A2K9VHH0_9CAUD|nr:DNA ligase [Pseudomonas phage Henninger]AUV61722.1 DNA ligase [Pseudomonas phage Henninger]
MTFLSVACPIIIVILSLCLWACYNTSKPLREKAREEAQREIDKAAAEAKRIAQGVRDAEVAAGVELALRVLFNEAREYDVRTEERRKEDRHRYGYKPPVFNRETREVFHKALRVGALEERVDRIEEGNKVRRDQHRKIAQQVESIQEALKPYA